MKICSSIKRERGMTLVELLVVIAIIAIFACMIIPASTPNKARAFRIQCVNNLKQTGLAFRIWEGDHGGNFPMAISQTNGGTMEFVTGMNEFRHFQTMSNELSTPKVLVCPAESGWPEKCATNFTAFSNSNISFFVGIVSNDTSPTLLLSGDRNITNGTLIKNGILTLTTNVLAGWTSKFHNKVGNILLADGSVQQDNIGGLRQQIAETGVVTNLEQMPVTGP